MDSGTWRLFVVLWFAGIVGFLAGLPYALSAAPVSVVGTSGTVVVVTVQAGVVLAVAVLIGVALGPKVGLGAPVVSALLTTERPASAVGRLRNSFATGVTVGAGIFLVDSLFAELIGDGATRVFPPLWQRAFATLYGGLFEELLLRFGFLTLLVWASWKIVRTPEGDPRPEAVGACIVLAAIAFGFAHLPLMAEVTELTPLVVSRTVVLNGVTGIVFGWLYWQQGIEAAMVAHFGADVAVHVVLVTVLASV
ncbi:CPBP family intramembrane glutamic endopeptidase [Halegenticoccus soli]|uniref:CPBP family intramembrane glutamic endopeptidase n=1 Tax=Halegenticoccus soli TaxID=1985678 RepID=UPI000C6D67BA|nr:CPBP family intramembrane glutamic endopeptidase [Halegenticoccus soli]